MAYADLTATEKQELSEFMRNYRAAIGDTVRGLHKQSWVGRGRLNRQGCSMKTRTLVLLVLVLFAVTVASAYDYGARWVVGGSAGQPGVVNVYSPSVAQDAVHRIAEAAPGSTRPIAPEGTVCKYIGGALLDCGCRYARLALLIEPE